VTSLHRVRVLGRDVQVKSMASPEQVAEIESFVNDTIAELQSSIKTADPQIIAIMALLNLAESCIQHVRENSMLERMVSDRISGLIRRIDDQGCPAVEVRSLQGD
jgi:cell division protein ZapA